MERQTQLEIAFCSCPMMGHLNPLLPFIEELLNRGHAVTCFHDVDPKYRAKLESCGLNQCTSVPCDLKPPRPDFGGLGKKLYRPGSGPEFDAILQHYGGLDSKKPDVLVYDFFVPGAADAADSMGCPAVCIFPNAALSINPWPIDPSKAGLRYTAWCCFMDLMEGVAARILLTLRNRDRSARALRPMKEQDIYPCRTMQRMTIGCSGLGLELAVHAKSPLYQMVGPSLPTKTEPLGELHNWITQQTRPLVYVAFGTDFHHSEKSVQNLQQQLFQIDAAVIWSLPESQQKWLKSPLPSSWRVEPFVPQLAVLQSLQLKAFVTHCGSNSLYEALLNRVPMVCCPFLGDQPGNATRLAKAGVGVIAYKGYQGLGVASALAAVLHDNAGFKERADRLCRILASQGGASRAADIIERSATLGYSHLLPEHARTSWSGRLACAALLAGLVLLIKRRR
jgi:MGT family glycosyltransferase